MRKNSNRLMGVARLAMQLGKDHMSDYGAGVLPELLQPAPPQVAPINETIIPLVITNKRGNRGVAGSASEVSDFAPVRRSRKHRTCPTALPMSGQMLLRQVKEL
jgi:hypothetical protein